MIPQAAAQLTGLSIWLEVQLDGVLKGRMELIPAAVSTGSRRQSAQLEQSLGGGLPALWPAPVMTSSRTAVDLGLPCLGPGLWAFAFVEKARPGEKQSGPAGGGRDARMLTGRDLEWDGAFGNLCLPWSPGGELGRCAW